MTTSTFEWLFGLLDPLLDYRDPVGSSLNLSTEFQLGIRFFRLATSHRVESGYKMLEPVLYRVGFGYHEKNRVRCTNEIFACAIRHPMNASKGPKPTRVWKWILWIKPPNGWVKLDTDGASRGNSSLASAGGVLCDVDGIWVSGFAHNVGFVSTVMVELWGVFIGLQHAWEFGHRRIILEVDSEGVLGPVSSVEMCALHKGVLHTTRLFNFLERPIGERSWPVRPSLFFPSPEEQQPRKATLVELREKAKQALEAAKRKKEIKEEVFETPPTGSLLPLSLH
ncbi:hypothetical protein CRG98_035894 [Punica granatum]|uniref:RNase H type-1 domain-containing protein n=1 Tax=Punica granatum TaxID=22663 RepID=A0A2I0II85_PUNGR|nr:hypothetical protein CRG98_035894 [Punica granatum]